MISSPVVSVDLAYTSYARNGLVVLTKTNGTINADLISVPLTGSPDPRKLAEYLAQLAEQRSAGAIFLDGPQGWRDPQRDASELRVCERKLAAPAKTGTPGNVKPKNYAGFVQFSIAVFDALDRLGWPRLEDPAAIDSHRAVESFPLAAWRALRLPALPAKAKAKPHDIEERLATLQQFIPITMSRTPTHDELQAIVAGLAGFSDYFDVRAEGVSPTYIDGFWREGFIVLPKPKVQLASSNEELFTICEDRWYAWQMLPGYASDGYFSPIHVGRFRALKTGKGLVEIAFFNAGYASGAQGFFVKGRVIKRAPDFMILDLAPNGQPERAAIISELSQAWLWRFTDISSEIGDLQDFLSHRYHIESTTRREEPE